MEEKIDKKGPIIDLTILGVSLAALYWTVAPLMAHDWLNDENYSHGIIVPFLSAYILWTHKDKLAELAAKGTVKGRAGLFGLFVCLASLAMYIVGRAGAEFFLQRASLVFLLAGAVVWIWGWQVFRAASFPLLFLFMMVPLPYLVYDSVAFPLKLFAAKVATELLYYLHVPVLRDGNIIQLPHDVTLEVADACSGIRSLMSLIALGLIFAYFMEKSTWKRIVIVASTIPIAVAANVFRVTGTGLLVYHWSPKAAHGFFHEFSGWLVFVVAFLGLFGVGALLRLIGDRKS